jgi:hypothetical protein
MRPAGDSTVTESSWRWVGPISAIVLGVVLLVAATVDLTDRGPLVPAGGGTFDGPVGPALLAAWFAASARDRAEAVSGWLVAIGLTAATVASLADLAGFGIRMQRDDGGFVRSAALGVTLFVIGLVILRNDTRSQVE